MNYYGHDQVVVLNGGFPKWQREQRPEETDIALYSPATFTPHVQPQLRATADDVLTYLHQQSVKLIDARDTGQYTGKIVRGE